MKSIKIAILIIILSLLSNVMFAQVSVGINIGIPVAARYYYLQDIEAYFDIQASMYIYHSGSRWIHARVLPSSYGHYDFNNGHKVIINDYRGNSPYIYFKHHRTQFPKGHYGKTENNHWSPKEMKEQGKQNKRQNKEFQKSNKKQNKEFQKINKNQGNGNKSFGGNKGKNNKSFGGNKGKNNKSFGGNKGYGGNKGNGKGNGGNKGNGKGK